MSEIPEPRPASTVVLLREGADGLETLLLRRNKALMFAGGLWVFPGGALEPADLEAAGDDPLLASRIAAAREAEEESGLHPHREDMVLVSHWTTPVVEPRRFSTWIYAAPVAVEKDVVIDGGEIHDHLWIGLNEALQRHRRGELPMLPPTFVTLSTLASYGSLDALVAAERSSGVPEVFPVIAGDAETITIMFRGDAGYESGNSLTPGARHRVVLQDKAWAYVHSGADTGCPALIRS